MNVTYASQSEQRMAAGGVALRYSDIGTGDIGAGDVPVVLLHGLFGNPSNWHPVMLDLAEHYRFLAPQLPIDQVEVQRGGAASSLPQLTDYVVRFFDELGLDRAVLCGNSLGGQVALDFTLKHPERVESLVLCGSAGLFERNLAGGRLPRLCRDFIRDRVAEIFYDQTHVSADLVDDVFAMLSDRRYRRYLLKIAKATRDRYMLTELSAVRAPTLIVWGREDSITPPFVAEQFCEHIHLAELAFIDRCGHSPPIEQPEAFSRLLHAYLSTGTSSGDLVSRKPR
jgi:pimeloyl-ACP methyl ester carboxylesterase